MGQQAAKPSKSDPELGRIHEVFDLISLAFQQLKRLGGPAYAEEARGVPATPGSQQAQYAAAFEHLKRLFAERDAIVAHIGGCFLQLAARPCGSALADMHERAMGMPGLDTWQPRHILCWTRPAPGHTVCWACLLSCLLCRVQRLLSVTIPLVHALCRSLPQRRAALETLRPCPPPHLPSARRRCRSRVSMLCTGLSFAAGQCICQLPFPSLRPASLRVAAGRHRTLTSLSPLPSPPALPAEAEPAPLPSECADKSEPSNPLSSAILHREQLGSSSCGTGSSSGSGSSSGGEAALPSNAECPESAPLLAAPARQLAPGLRRRPGNAGSETLY